MKKLTVGQMARLNRISEQTLRLYDKEGLLSPAYREPSNGYRYYTIRQSAQLDMIQYMKSLGMTLKEISQQMKQTDLSLIQRILEENKRSIEKQIKQLNYQKRAIERTLESYERYETAPPDGSILIEYIPKRRMYLVDSKVNFYDYEIDVYEQILRDLKETLIREDMPQIYFCNAGTILRKDKLLRQEFYSTEVFVLVDKDYVDETLITTIPSNTYLCIYCDKFEKEKEYINRLLVEIEERHYKISGDYICEVIAELPANLQERGMYLRLQVPIQMPSN
ncbi:MAG: MerR family transcriptional regulator [Lachnospiraceae bacterium]|nr:MerR family transcriptional regulator [Lachnospiraceae bacterium]